MYCKNDFNKCNVNQRNTLLFMYHSVKGVIKGQYKCLITC